MIIVGCREGREFRFPNPNPGTYVPAGAVLTHKPIGEPNPSKIVYCKRPDLRPNPYHGQLFNGGGRPIDLSMPAPTILASAGGNKTHFLDCGGHVPPYHRHLVTGGAPRLGELPQARQLTIAESATVQTFPAGFVFIGLPLFSIFTVGQCGTNYLAETLGQRLSEHMTACLVSRKRVAA